MVASFGLACIINSHRIAYVVQHHKTDIHSISIVYRQIV